MSAFEQACEREREMKASGRPARKRPPGTGLLTSSAAVGKMVKKKNASFYMQKAADQFYPDFLAKLKDGQTARLDTKLAQAKAGL